jgi:protein-tyrosine phosphatase
MAALGVQTVVSLLDTVELTRLGAKNLPHHLALHAIDWHQLPVVDFGVPTQAVTSRWKRLMPQLTQVLQSGNLLIHCAQGKGRSHATSMSHNATNHRWRALSRTLQRRHPWLQLPLAR